MTLKDALEISISDSSLTELHEAIEIIQETSNKVRIEVGMKTLKTRYEALINAYNNQAGRKVFNKSLGKKYDEVE